MTQRQTSSFLKYAKEAYKIKMQIKLLEKQHDESIKQLLIICHEQPTSFGGYNLNKFVRPGAVQYKDIDILKSIDLNKYRSADVSYWKLNKEVTQDDIDKI